MRRIIDMKEYALLFSMGILGFIIFRNLENLSTLKTIQNISDISMYLYILYLYILVFTEACIRNYRLKSNEMEIFMLINTKWKILIINLLVLLHALYWYLLSIDSNISIAGLMGVSIIALRTVLINSAYFSEIAFVYQNRMYFVKDIDELIDDSDSSFKIIVNGSKKTINCGFFRFKEKLVKEVNLLRGLI